MNTSKVRRGMERSEPLSSADAMLRLHQESCRRLEGALAGRNAVAALHRTTTVSEWPPPGEACGPVIPLPAPRMLQATYEGMLQRVSVRSYDSQAVELDQIASVLKAAFCGDRREWLGEASAIPLAIRLVAWRVEGLSPGVYSYVPESHGLRRDGPAPDPVSEGPSLTLQLEFTEAPFLVFITASLATSVARHGSRGYRLLLLRAGAAGYRAWMAAIGARLGGVTFAGFLPAAARRYLGADGYQECCLFAFAGGKPAPAAN